MDTSKLGLSLTDILLMESPLMLLIDGKNKQSWLENWNWISHSHW